MKLRNLHLDYKDENGDLRYELRNGAHSMKDAEGFSPEEFYSSLDNIIRVLSPNNSFRPIEAYPSNNGPKALFGFLFYFLKGMGCKKGLQKEFDYLEQFIDYEIDLFMIVNFLREL